MWTTRRTLMIVSLLVLGTLAACAGRPTLSGFPIGDTRIVGIGDVLELRIPIDKQGNRTWRVASYDSLYVSLVDSPQVNEAGDTLIAKAVARTAGTTQIVLTSVPGVGETSEEMTFKLEIVP